MVKGGNWVGDEAGWSLFDEVIISVGDWAEVAAMVVRLRWLPWCRKTKTDY